MQEYFHKYIKYLILNDKYTKDEVLPALLEKL